MNRLHDPCRVVRSLIPRMNDNLLRKEEWDFITSHLEVCPECAAAIAGEAISEIKLSQQESEEQIHRILLQTSGSSCETALELYFVSLNDPVSSNDQNLMDTHLNHCAHCQSIINLWKMAERELPAMASLPADNQFTGEVIRETSQCGQRPSLATRWISLWNAFNNAFLNRRRFAWEISYVITLPIVLFMHPYFLNGLPPGLHYDSLRMTLSKPVVNTFHTIDTLYSNIEQAATDNYDAAMHWVVQRVQPASQKINTIESSYSEIKEHFTAMSTSLKDKDIFTAIASMRKIWKEFRTTWNDVMNESPGEGEKNGKFTTKSNDE